MTEQSRRASFAESCCNVGSGMVIALITWEIVIEPLYGIDKDITENLGITAIFTAVSLVRGYLWRRAFNKGGQ